MGRPKGGGRSNGVGEEPLGSWRNERLELFREEARRRGIGHPLIVRSAGLRPGEALFPGIAAVAARQDLRFVTPREYFDLAQGLAPSLRYGLDGMGSAIPWGLDGEHLQRHTVETENALLLAERLDALAYAMGRQSEEKEIDGAWKLLLRSQHRDFRAYGPCIPKQQRKRVADVAGETARASRETGRRVAEEAASLSGVPREQRRRRGARAGDLQSLVLAAPRVHGGHGQGGRLPHVPRRAGDSIAGREPEEGGRHGGLRGTRPRPGVLAAGGAAAGKGTGDGGRAEEGAHAALLDARSPTTSTRRSSTSGGACGWRWRAERRWKRAAT